MDAKAREGNVRTAAVAHAVGGVAHVIQSLFDLQELGIGPFLNEFVERAEPFAGGLIKAVG